MSESMSESTKALKRIADAMDEILRLIKADQKHTKEYMEKEKAHEGNFADGR